MKSIEIKELVRYFGLAFGISWLLWLPNVLATAGLFALPFPPVVLAGLGSFGPSVAALLLTGRSGGWAEVKRLLRAGLTPRLPLLWWAAILLLPLILSWIVFLSSRSLSQYEPDTTLLNQGWLILPTFLFMFFVGGSVQEEFGWRGYALPRLLKRLSPFWASILLGSAWGFWHLPLFFTAGVSQAYMSFGVFFGLLLAFSVVFTWFYQRTKESLFSALLLHAAINTCFSIFPPIEQKAGGNQTALLYLAIVYSLVALEMVLKEKRLWLARPTPPKPAPPGEDAQNQAPQDAA